MKPISHGSGGTGSSPYVEAVKASRSGTATVLLVTAFVVLFGLLPHAYYVSRYVPSVISSQQFIPQHDPHFPGNTERRLSESGFDLTSDGSRLIETKEGLSTRHFEDNGMAVTQRLPDLFIYRRSKKTGSSSMLAALLDVLVPLGYVPLYMVPEELRIVVYHEYRKTHPRRLFVAQHNDVKRSFHPQRNAIIADTIRSGYDQVTSFCRYARDFNSCGDERMLECLKRRDARLQHTYRWAFKKKEDSDTYIDLPLSSAHPALSTKVLRTIFGPNVTLNMQHYNAHNSSCPEIPAVREVYNEYYKDLDSDVAKLSKRMLVIAGYTMLTERKLVGNVTIDELLDAAERIEREKLGLQTNFDKDKGISKAHYALNHGMKKWVRDSDGDLTLKDRF